MLMEDYYTIAECAHMWWYYGQYSDNLTYNQRVILVEKYENMIDDKLKEISEFDWSFEIGDRVITNDEVARSANPIPWEITGKVIQKKGLLPESLPREGKFVYGENIPYYTVQRRGGDSDELEKISLPEWAIAQKFGINKEGALNNLVEE